MADIISACFATNCHDCLPQLPSLQIGFLELGIIHPLTSQDLRFAKA
jgi:hypothetical protein